jgi:hypothetical protein
MLATRSRVPAWLPALFLLALLLLILDVTGSASAAPKRPRAHPALPPPLGGVNIIGLDRGSTPADADRAISLAHSMHARVVRTELPWEDFEPSGPGQINPVALAFTDRLISDAAADGIRVIATVDTSPCWATAAPPSLLASCSPTQPSAANGWPPSEPESYARFVAYLAARYGTKLAAIEIWNEPDQVNEQYFGGANKAQRYAAVLRAAYPAIKAANPKVAVLGGSFVGTNGVFLRALYAAGIKGYYDGLAVHFYTLTLAALRSIHQLQLENGDHTPLWLSEFGWSSCYPASNIEQEQDCVTPATQALNLTNTFRSLSSARYVAAAVVYKLQDDVGEEFGALTASGKRKPSFKALSSAFVSPFGPISRVTLKLKRSGGQVVASGSGPVGDFIELEASTARVRFKSQFTLNRFNQYSLTLPSVLGSSGVLVRVYEPWGGPSRGAQKRI